jgi:hypothetical protein
MGVCGISLTQTGTGHGGLDGSNPVPGARDDGVAIHLDPVRMNG